MIKINNIEVFGWKAAIRGTRNPMNSWDKSDTEYYTNYYDLSEDKMYPLYVDIGPNDLELMKKLVTAGTDHSKFMRMIHVQMDITAPLYWWLEFDTYKVGTVANSCSKMHRLLKKPFDIADFSFDKLPGYRKEIKQFRPEITDDMVQTEQWINVDNDYSVSNYGRIRHHLLKGYRVLSGSLHKDGYIYVTLHDKQIPLHRLIAKYFYKDTYSENLVVNHKDGNKQNNFVPNLEWVTCQENIKHSRENSLQPLPVKKYTGKFTQEQRDEIKRLWDNGNLSKRELAKKYGVSHTCINDIINDKYKYANGINLYEEVARPWIDTLNELRDSYLISDNENEKKEIWYSIIQLLPESYNQKRTVDLNYEVLRNIYFARRNHKLDEWREFCNVILNDLPYFAEIIGVENEDE